MYQVYPRSFADANGDGTGDVAGIIERLPYLARLGVDAIWVSPWYRSPLADGGYDVADYRDINPDFGTLADADRFVAAAHDLGVRVLIDLVPNHCSEQHPWFQAALAAAPGSPERDRFIFRDTPNNWPAMFGGSAWERTTNPDGTPGQWYLHLFAPEQPDWNWENPEVADEFDSILRFWFDRGIDGFRIDVANSMAKAPGLPDLDVDADGKPLATTLTGTPYMNQPHVHEILRRWRAVADEYADTELGARVFVSEAWVTPADELAKYVRSDELHTTFNFDALMCEWSADSQRNVIDLTLAATGAVGAPATWVLANHDTVRVATRYGRAISGARFTPAGMDMRSFAGVGKVPDGETDIELGRKRARAAVLLELALPGGAYVYEGDELGLDEVEDLPDDMLQDPIWERSNHTSAGPRWLPRADPVERRRAAIRVRLTGLAALAAAAGAMGVAHRRGAGRRPVEPSRAVPRRARRAPAQPGPRRRNAQVGRHRAGWCPRLHPRARLPLHRQLRTRRASTPHRRRRPRRLGRPRRPRRRPRRSRLARHLTPPLPAYDTPSRLLCQPSGATTT